MGAGNLAWSLIPALQRANYQVEQLISRNSEALIEFQQAFDIPQVTSDLKQVDEEVEAIILTVSDQAIAEVAKQLPSNRYTLIHCSGNTPLSILPLEDHVYTGVLYPLQSFTKGTLSDFDSIPLFLETQAGNSLPLEELGNALSSRVYWLTSEKRKTLHLGAVWANNFSNLMYRYAEELLADHTDLDFNVYLPLLEGHIHKLKEFSPSQLQTGPAVRGDVPTLLDHIEQLDSYPSLEKIYRLLSQQLNSSLKM